VAVSDEERDRERERIEAEYTYLETDESNVRLVPEFKGIDVAIVKAKQNVYLRGGVFDTFDGTHWLNRYEKLHPAIQEEGLLSIENIIESNVFEHLYAVAIKEGIELDVQPDSTLEELVDSKFSPYFYIDPIRVTNKKFLSYSLIAPLNYMNVTYREDFVYKNLTITKDGIIQSNQYTRENHVYTSSTLVPYYDTPEIQDILRKSYKGYYDNLNDRFLTHELKSRARDVYDKYLNIPDTIHPKVIQLAHTLTRDYHNDFDKVKAIEAYLKENHTYTLTPNNTQGDYVYNFLFETKEGFCTSFATAMVLMVREIGVPARYVTGFAAKDIFELYDYTYDELQQKIYTVKDHNAHAWVEVYFEGFGWVPFEPTSGFQLQDEIYEKEEKTLKIEDKNRRVNFYLPPKLQEGLIYGLLLLLCVVLPLYIRIRKVMAIKKKAVQEKFVVFYELALTLLKHRGYTRKQEETMSQFIERYRGILQEENYPLEEMNQIYEDIYYGQLTVDQEHLEKIKDFYSKTKKRSWKYGNKLKYMWLIYTAQIL
jgi:transglutaminase-like putative cysteine protease